MKILNNLNNLKKKLLIKANLNKCFKNIYLKLAEIIFLNKLKSNKKIIIGLTGSQGSGKTTFAQFLKIILEKKYNLKTIIISIDDIYKTKKDRISFSKKISNLFLTRGVPGTHDVKYLVNYFKNLNNTKKNRLFSIPKFDKSIDDRMPKKYWHHIKNNFDVIIFEGWCVGARPEYSHKNLVKPINVLEKVEDKNLKWRKKVNFLLKNDYKKLFSYINFFIYLKVPSFKKVFLWRNLQELKLRNLNQKNRLENHRIMSKLQIKKFIMFYERITRKMFIDMPKLADIVVPIDVNHQPKKIIINK
jgi:D-glycerate 3-kinase